LPPGRRVMASTIRGKERAQLRALRDHRRTAPSRRWALMR
jgi:hypothetical protein